MVISVIGTTVELCLIINSNNIIIYNNNILFERNTDIYVYTFFVLQKW